MLGDHTWPLTPSPLSNRDIGAANYTKCGMNVRKYESSPYSRRTSGTVLGDWLLCTSASNWVKTGEMTPLDN